KRRVHVSTSQSFPLPDVGEGLTEAEIVSWRVAPGDTVEVNQVVVEIETAKSLVELPSPFGGVVEALLVEVGQTVAVGTPIISVATEGADAPAAGTPAAGAEGAAERHPDAAPDSETAPLVADTAASVTEEEKPGAVLVGYGISGAATSRRRRKDARPAPASVVPATSGR